jgi:hypothetical protein
MSGFPATTESSAAIALLELIQGAVVTQAIHVAASLRVADALSDGSLTSTEIAERVGADPEAVHRLLRLLSGYSVFAQESDDRFKLTPMADALRADAPDSMRGIALLMGHPTLWEEWVHLVTSVRTGEANMPKLRGMHPFEYIAANPEYGMAFGYGMACLSGVETAPVLAAYDFSRFRKVVDVGGGRGALLAGILRQAADAHGILFDSPHGTTGADSVLAEAGVADRCTIQNGSYFEGVPSGGDAYLLKHTVHDFPEPMSLQILRNIRDAISPDGTLLVMEYVLTEENTKHVGNIFDMWLMLLLDGKERTQPQYAALLAAAGFRLNRIVPTTSPVSIIEALPA